MQQKNCAGREPITPAEQHYLTQAEGFARTIAQNCADLLAAVPGHAVCLALKELALCHTEWLTSKDPVLTEKAGQLVSGIEKTAADRIIGDIHLRSHWYRLWNGLEDGLLLLCNATPQPPAEADAEMLRSHGEWLRLWKRCFLLIQEAESSHLSARLKKQETERGGEKELIAEVLLSGLSQGMFSSAALPMAVGGVLIKGAVAGAKLLRNLKTFFSGKAPETALSPEELLVGKRQSAPITKVDQVHFSALTDAMVEPNRHYRLKLYLYPQQQRQVIDAILDAAQQKLMEEKTSLPVAMRTEQKITIQLSSPSVQLPLDTLTIPWTGTAQEFSFSYYVPDGIKEQNIVISANIYLDGVIATMLQILVPLGRQALRLELSRRDVTRVFFSYSSDDRLRVLDIAEGFRCARPDLTLFLDVLDLRAADKWEDRLTKEIDRCQALYLCWSRGAQRSVWVQREWRYAYETKGLEAVEPIPLEPPSLCAPPDELKSKHFNDLTTLVAYAERASRKEQEEQEKTVENQPADP